MDIFGGRWLDHVSQIEKNWLACVNAEDTVVLCGDTSWGMDLNEALEDFRFLQNLPGRKIILKGNHDYWWNTLTKLNAFTAEHGLTSLHFLHNNTYTYKDYSICGTRGWLFEEAAKEADFKIIAREALRLNASLSAAPAENQKLVFLHYPPAFANSKAIEIIKVMKEHGVTVCCYGHLHGVSSSLLQHNADGISFHLVAGDHIAFDPLKLAE